MIKELRSLWVAHTCYACNTPLSSQEAYICLSCQSMLQPTQFHESPLENELYYRLAGRVKLDGATSLYYFDKKGTLQTLIKQLKYHDAPNLGTHLGKMLGKTLEKSPFLEGIDAIVPIPLHWKKQITRGYNQSAYIARGISRETMIPVAGDILKRKRKTRTQTRLSTSSRWENVAQAFEVVRPCSQGILLIDDVITTGSTLEAAMRAIWSHTHPPQKIKVASIGMARNS